MPQYAIIKADGTGDYTTVEAWRAAEIKNNYGEMTIGVVDGLVSSGGTLLFHKAASDDWPQGVGLVAADGQAYNGYNLSTCARISHTSSVIEQGDVDLLLQGLYVNVTAGYNNKTFRFAASYPTTQRRSLTINKCAFGSSPNYHGGTSIMYLTLVSTNANSQYELDIQDLVLMPRASNNALDFSALSGNLDITGTINRMTVTPTNTSGSSAQESVYLGPGSSCTVALDNILALGSQGRTNYVDYINDGFAGTVGNIVTADNRGTITGETGATQLEDVAAADYRLKSTSYGFGAFPQAEDPQSTQQGSGQSSAITSSSGIGYRASSGNGVSSSAALVSAFGYAKLSGYGSSELQINTASYGYRSSVGSGLSSAEPSSAGEGYSFHAGGGHSIAGTSSYGFGLSPSLTPNGYGNSAISAQAFGVGYAKACGAGRSDLSAHSDGAGYMLSLGHGISELSAISIGSGVIPVIRPSVVLYTDIQRYTSQIEVESLVVKTNIQRVVING